MKIGAVDVEEFSRNLARLVEEGGRALAAYLKPREEGRNTNEMAEEVTEVVKTLGHVAEYWLEDPQRTLEVQTRLGKAYLDLWASAARRLAGEDAAPFITPDKNDKRFSDPEWSSNQFYDFLKQAYLLTARWADQLVTDAEGLDQHTRQKAEFYTRQQLYGPAMDAYHIAFGIAAKDPVTRGQIYSDDIVQFITADMGNGATAEQAAREALPRLQALG